MKIYFLITTLYPAAFDLTVCACTSIDNLSVEYLFDLSLSLLQLLRLSFKIFPL
jgi:hypothetical protein